MTNDDVYYLMNMPKGDALPRAVRWAWIEIPKSRYDEEKGWQKITKIDHRVFQYLKEHRDEYYEFLKKNNLEKTVYDKYIGKHEPEVRTTW